MSTPRPKTLEMFVLPNWEGFVCVLRSLRGTRYVDIYRSPTPPDDCLTTWRTPPLLSVKLGLTRETRWQLEEVLEAFVIGREDCAERWMQAGRESAAEKFGVYIFKIMGVLNDDNA